MNDRREGTVQQELYADGIGEITVSGSVVRIDFVSLSATEKDIHGRPKPVVRQRVIMPLDGFANASDLMAKAVKGLEEAGAIHRNPSAGDAHIVPPGEARPGRSPNFS